MTVLSASFGYNPQIAYPVVCNLCFKQPVVLVCAYYLVLLLPAELHFPLEFTSAFFKIILNSDSVL